MATECPHCFRTIIPLAGGNCPNCRRNVKDAPPQAAGMKSIWIDEKMQLPQVCCACGERCQRFITVSQSMAYSTTDSRSYRRDDGAAVRLGASLILGGLFVKLYELFTSGEPTDVHNVVVKVKMPHCHNCSSQQPLEPQKVDFDYCKMRFAVCQRFVDFLESPKNQFES